MIKDISLIITGAVLGLISAWLKSIWDRRSTSSNTLFDMRLNAINKIWHSFLKVKAIYGQKIPLGHDNWLRTHKEDSLNSLIEYRQIIDENQVILDHCITDGFLNLEYYMYNLLSIDDQVPSDYIGELNQRLSSLSDAINKSMGKRTHTVRLKLK
jgi:hypothetical protein